MTREEIRDALLAFLTLPDRVAGRERNDAERMLMIALDRIASVTHWLDHEPDDRDHPSPERIEYAKALERWSAVFPDFEHYNMALPVLIRDEETVFATGDPLDDLANLNLDLQGAIDRWD